MSYDLFMKPKNGTISIDHFQSYFESRKHYAVEGLQALYQNEDTAVYFSFEYQDEEDEEEYFPLVFNMNFFRPCFFALEAEPEVRAFISKFNLTVDDPQINGMGTGEYNTDKFLSGWFHGNEFGYKSILNDNPKVHALPSATLKKVWAWNFDKERLQNELNDDVFVPSIMLFNYQKTIVTSCVWPDAIPAVIPPVDILLIRRNELAPRKYFRKVEDIVIGTWNEFLPLFDHHKNKMQDEAYFLMYQSVPIEIKSKIQSLTAIDLGMLELLPLDKVFDRELVQKYTV